MGGYFILKKDFEEVLKNFLRYKREDFEKDNYILRFVHDNLPKEIKSNIEGNYTVKGSVGKGNWADCPTVSILDNDITNSTQDGIYLVYLFKSDMSGVYLSFTWGSYQFKKHKEKLHEAVEDVRNLLFTSNKIENFELGESMDLISNAARPKSYEEASIVFKYYSLENFPDDEILINDLNEYLRLYDFVKENYDGKYRDLIEFNSRNKTQQYWIFSPDKNAYEWNEFYDKGIMGIGWNETGDLNKYNSQNEIANKLKEISNGDNSLTNDSLACWQFVNDMQINDVVFARNGIHELIGVGVVKSDYEYNQDYDFCHIRKVDWFKNGQWFFEGLNQKTLTKIEDQDVIDELKKVIEEDKICCGKNTLIYGVPGAGKSWTIKNKKCKGVDENYIERVVFHPDYTYSDFVGQILPKVSENGVEYKFIPGPFTNILKKAYENNTENVYLIIEEINRGNAPAIFGDVFQLLDRVKEDVDGLKKGTSEFGITNSEIAAVVYGDETHKVRIPSNLHIIATMNTSDQNVFTLDTAFKRRWHMEMIENDFSKPAFKDVCVPNSEVTWEVFGTSINEIILEESNSTLSSEDKRLGAYFVDEEDLRSPDEFAEKVLMYLWDDVFKFSREDYFNENSVDLFCLESFIKKFVNTNWKNHLTIFTPIITNKIDEVKERLSNEKEENES